MRIINRVVLTKETKDSVVTRVTERIVETDQNNVMLVSGVVQTPGEASNVSEFQVMCNICTYQFNYDNSGKCCCPSCGSRDVSLV